jgi:uncharacterized protein YerC
MKRKPNDLSIADQKFTRKILFEAAKSAQNNKQLEAFLEGLLTPSEQIMLGRRLWVSRMLLEKKGYDEIGQRLFVGPNTVAKIEMWLRGQLPDYGEYLKNAEQNEIISRRRRAAKENPFGLTALKMKYPLHFLFFPWPKQ